MGIDWRGFLAFIAMMAAIIVLLVGAIVGCAWVVSHIDKPACVYSGDGPQQRPGVRR